MHFARDVLQSLLPKWLGGLRLGFQVSGVEESPIHAVKERDAEKRPNVFTRLWWLHLREGILWHLALVLAMTILTAFRVRAEVVKSVVDGKVVQDEAFWIRFISSVGFPGLALIETIPLHLTPIIYAIFPPNMPTDRRECMEYDDETGLWRASPKFKTIKWTISSLWLEIPHFLGAVWLTYAFLIVHGSNAKEKVM